MWENKSQNIFSLFTFSPAPIQKHPDFPKKPLTPYFRFFMEKRAKYAKLHPEMSNLDLTKILSKKYKELPEKKKVSSTYLECDEGYQEWHNSVSSFAYQQQATFLLVLLAKLYARERKRERKKPQFFPWGN